RVASTNLRAVTLGLPSPLRRSEVLSRFPVCGSYSGRFRPPGAVRGFAGGEGPRSPWGGRVRGGGRAAGSQSRREGTRGGRRGARRRRGKGERDRRESGRARR